MENVEIKVEGSKMTIVVDLAHRIGPSKSGLTTLVATSGGIAPVPLFPEMKLSMSVFTKASK